MAKVRKCSVLFLKMLVTVARVFVSSQVKVLERLTVPTNGNGPIQDVYVPRQIFVWNGRLL